jgi:hypothetical protein
MRLKGLLLGLFAGAGVLLGTRAFALSEWTDGISTAMTSSTSDLVTLITGTVLPIVLSIFVGFFVIRWAMRKIFGRGR